MPAWHTATLVSRVLRRSLSRSLMLASLVTMLGAAFVVTANPAHAAAAADPVVTNESIPLDIVAFNDCNGDLIHLTGELHDLFTVTFDGAGGAHFTFHDNPQGVSGEDLTTGAKYQGTGVTRGGTNFTAGGTLTDTFVNNFRLIGQGQAPNLDVHDNLHVTILPDGTVTSSHDNFSLTCH